MAKASIATFVAATIVIAFSASASQIARSETLRIEADSCTALLSSTNMDVSGNIGETYIAWLSGFMNALEFQNARPHANLEIIETDIVAWCMENPGMTFADAIASVVFGAPDLRPSLSGR